MKASTLLLIVSLVANGLLAWGLTRSAPALSPSTPPRSSAVPVAIPNDPAASALAAPSSSARSVAATQVQTPSTTLWSQLQTDDFGEYARRLRAAGFPAREVRALLAIAIEAWANSRREALVGKLDNLPYWQSYAGTFTKPEIQAKLGEIYRESNALYYQYVNGPDALAENEDALANAQRRYGMLSLDKLQRLTALDHDLQEKLMEYSQRRSQARPGDEAAAKSSNTEFRRLQQENLAAVAQLLTPDELEQYELRNGSDAAGLRMTLENFQPTEAEFKALYAINRKMSSLYATANASPADAAAARDKWTTQVQAALTPERYADFQAVQNAGSNELGKLMVRLELPPVTISKVNAVRDDINQRAAVVRNDPGLTASQRTTQLAALATEAGEKLTSTLGVRGYNAYADLKGDWIRALKTNAP